jgi:hypothetical protein
MKILAYVSDEMYVAIPGVVADWESLTTGDVTVLHSSARGAFYSDLSHGMYRVTLAREGFGSKTVEVELSGEIPYQFRLLSDSIVGYAWPKWVVAGQPAEYRVHAVEEYRLSLWRYGAQKELVQVITWMDEHGPQANRQILPDGDFTRSGARWNSEGYATPPTVTAPDRSGLYYFHATTRSGRSFRFPWVVAPARPQSSVAVLASTNTWNAYNNYGGRSNYVNATRLPDSPVVYSRQDLDRYQDRTPFGTWRFPDSEYGPLSFDRPEPGNHIFDDGKSESPVQGRVQCGLAPGEWRLYAWLEREGFSYDLYAEAQLHDGTLDLREYRVLIIAVHPEYWTRTMYLKVKSWVQEQGGRLMYLGGNGLNCEVVLNEDATMTCLTHLRSTHGEMGGLSDDGTTEFESRMHRTLESEANLLGVVCTESGIMTAAPYRVTDASHWVYEDTGLRDNDLFGRVTLHERIPGGASGHETDKRSKSSPPDTVLLAKGTNPDNGGSEIVMVRHKGGGAVFSVGSITWVAALFTDQAVAAITRNVLTRFLAEDSAV